eukprot:4273035-Amphidinium_carterae.3
MPPTGRSIMTFSMIEHNIRARLFAQNVHGSRASGPKGLRRDRRSGVAVLGTIPAAALVVGNVEQLAQQRRSAQVGAKNMPQLIQVFVRQVPQCLATDERKPDPYRIPIDP